MPDRIRGRKRGNQRPLRVYSPSYVSLVWISILLIYGFATVAAAEQNMAPVSTSAIISDRLEIITFLCGSLSAREKSKLTDEVGREAWLFKRTAGCDKGAPKAATSRLLINVAAPGRGPRRLFGRSLGVDFRECTLACIIRR